MDRTEWVDTTMGELLAAITDSTAPCQPDQQQIYKAVAFVLAHVLNPTRNHFERQISWH